MEDEPDNIAGKFENQVLSVIYPTLLQRFYALRIDCPHPTHNL